MYGGEADVRFEELQLRASAISNTLRSLGDMLLRDIARQGNNWP